MDDSLSEESESDTPDDSESADNGSKATQERTSVALDDSIQVLATELVDAPASKAQREQAEAAKTQAPNVPTYQAKRAETQTKKVDTREKSSNDKKGTKIRYHNGDDDTMEDSPRPSVPRSLREVLRVVNWGWQENLQQCVAFGQFFGCGPHSMASGIAIVILTTIAEFCFAVPWYWLFVPWYWLVAVGFIRTMWPAGICG
ncbi:uncharacterized protein K452DRAFT_343971 [Aplosporella prunicola CBS 121167]|uniref:Uncharacterized protein n=1 Tax=Aplosporella prunicola CBS 121167 TaxID=1176127 RepID=A0A6A6B010_9PEZI|nr:uncharacterized protein K452DRAFT_343971 [Aplosporella prunicola CBS 121167]KAF2136367.1 hypothetical protein K452DRAFT_343971 [Aplosporella prunicola CBS 121167]